MRVFGGVRSWLDSVESKTEAQRAEVRSGLCISYILSWRRAMDMSRQQVRTWTACYTSLADEESDCRRGHRTKTGRPELSIVPSKVDVSVEHNRFSCVTIHIASSFLQNSCNEARVLSNFALPAFCGTCECSRMVNPNYPSFPSSFQFIPSHRVHDLNPFTSGPSRASQRSPCPLQGRPRSSGSWLSERRASPSRVA